MLKDIATKMMKRAHDNLHQKYRISHVTEICELPSMKLFKLFPHEWMHLILENHGKNLIHLWKGTYKGLDQGKEQYVIAKGTWVQIGLETTVSRSVPHIGGLTLSLVTYWGSNTKSGTVTNSRLRYLVCCFFLK